MVFAKLLSNIDGIIRYLYQPENNGEIGIVGEPGILVYDVGRKEASIERVAENDIKSTFYRNHVFKMIRENINELPEKIVLSWY